MLFPNYSRKQPYVGDFQCPIHMYCSLTSISTRIQVITHAKKTGEVLRLGRLLSFEIVEVNPVIDEHNRAGEMAVELALSVFGKKIL